MSSSCYFSLQTYWKPFTLGWSSSIDLSPQKHKSSTFFLPLSPLLLPLRFCCCALFLFQPVLVKLFKLQAQASERERMTPIAHIKLMKTQNKRKKERERAGEIQIGLPISWLVIVGKWLWRAQPFPSDLEIKIFAFWRNAHTPDYRDKIVMMMMTTLWVIVVLFAFFE